VSRTTTPERALESVERTAMRSADTAELFEVVTAALGGLVAFDGSLWFATDPATRFAAAPARFENLDGGYCDTFWHHEFQSHDVLLFRDLIRSGATSGSLHQATDDHPGRSMRWRHFLSPQGYDDEIRFVCRTGDNAWAVGALLREDGREPFDADDVALVARAAGLVAPVLRAHAAVAGAAPVHGSLSAPGLLVFSPDGAFLSANAEAEHWLDELCGPVTWTADGSWSSALAERSSFDLEVPTALTSLLASARAVALGLERGPSRLRLRTATGRWLVLHASTLSSSGGTESAIGVVIEPAKSAEIAPIIIDAYGLSARERDVVRAIARGASTPEIASELFLSPHTVRDHVKAVFEKVGVSSRGELVAKLFAEHYIDPMHAGAIEVG
jgi:DNA-binding CsgD family transcriptional regulator